MIRYLKAHHWIGHFHQIPTRGRWFEQALGKIHNPTISGKVLLWKAYTTCHQSGAQEMLLNPQRSKSDDAS